jgi:hypothetical protein
VAPRACAIAGELEALTPFELLTNATKLANLLAQLVRGARLDVAWVESGSNLACEVAGRTLDWSTFPPGPKGQASPAGAAGAMTRGRAAVAVEATRRLKLMLGEAAVVGVTLPGPLELATALPEIDPDDAVDILLPMVRSFTEAGAEVVLLTESQASPRPPGYASLMRPLTATARFHGALPIVTVPPGRLPGPGLIEAVEGAIGCLSLDDAAAHAWSGQFAVATPVPVPPTAIGGHRCVLVTTAEEVTGLFPAAALGSVVSSLRALTPLAGA